MPRRSMTRLRGEDAAVWFHRDVRDSQYVWRMLESDLIILITNGQRVPPPTYRLESWTVSTAGELVDVE
jgi:hypothetical protein